MAYPSKLYHRRLSALDEKSFSMGNLKNVPKSKSVISQCSYEYRKANQVDDSLINSLKTLKSMYNTELKSKLVPGFIQFISFDPLTVALWSERDIELYHEMSKRCSPLVDATGTVTYKLNGKEIFYFTFLSYDRCVKTEPVPHLEILTDRASFNTLLFALSMFLEDDLKRFGYTTNSIPILCTCDVSWPIIKCLIEAFNKETLKEYITRSYTIASGDASSNELPLLRRKTFVHISLCHSMKSSW